jgi:formiminoglutamase
VRKPSPKITSGSPFYLAIESGVLKGENLIEFGIQNHCNAPELWDYAESKKIQIVPFSELRVSEAKKANPAILAFRTALKKLEKKVDSIVISLDLDCMAEAHCPGVSAPQAEGFDTREVFEMLEIAARSCCSTPVHERIVLMGSARHGLVI